MELNINIVIIGRGAIGTFLAEILQENGNRIEFFDSKKYTTGLDPNPEIKINYSKILDLNFEEFFSNIDIIIVCVKSYSINKSLLKILIESRREILFLQNGVTTYLDHKDKSVNFHFGTIFGIQAQLIEGKLEVITQDCSLAVITAANIESIKNLKVELIKARCEVSLEKYSENLILEKFVRWLLVSIITSIRCLPLGKSLDATPVDSIKQGVFEITTYIKNEFLIVLSPETIFSKIYKLPRDMATSAYRDYNSGKSSEMIIELNRVIKSLENVGIEPNLLTKWYGDLTHGK